MAKFFWQKDESQQIAPEKLQRGCAVRVAQLIQSLPIAYDIDKSIPAPTQEDIALLLPYISLLQAPQDNSDTITYAPMTTKELKEGLSYLHKHILRSLQDIPVYIDPVEYKPHEAKVQAAWASCRAFLGYIADQGTINEFIREHMHPRHIPDVLLQESIANYTSESAAHLSLQSLQEYIHALTTKGFINCLQSTLIPFLYPEIVKSIPVSLDGREVSRWQEKSAIFFEEGSENAAALLAGLEVITRTLQQGGILIEMRNANNQTDSICIPLNTEQIAAIQSLHIEKSLYAFNKFIPGNPSYTAFFDIVDQALTDMLKKPITHTELFKFLSFDKISNMTIIPADIAEHIIAGANPKNTTPFYFPQNVNPSHKIAKLPTILFTEDTGISILNLRNALAQYMLAFHKHPERIKDDITSQFFKPIHIVKSSPILIDSLHNPLLASEAIIPKSGKISELLNTYLTEFAALHAGIFYPLESGNDPLYEIWAKRIAGEYN